MASVAAPKVADELSSSSVFTSWTRFADSGKNFLQTSKTFFSHRYTYLKDNDNDIHSVFLAAIAINLLYMGGIFGIITFTAFAVSANMGSEKIKETLEKIKFIWDDTKSGKLAVVTLGFVMFSLYPWQVACAVAGVYSSTLSVKKEGSVPADAAAVDDKSKAPPVPQQTNGKCTLL
jgi:hypothetical protein